jgi:hypothetical protein
MNRWQVANDISQIDTRVFLEHVELFVNRKHRTVNRQGLGWERYDLEQCKLGAGTTGDAEREWERLLCELRAVEGYKD